MLRARIWLGGAIVTLGLGLSAGSAQAAIAYTSEATAGGTSATAYGYVNTQGETTVWSFTYGTSTKYGSSSKAVAIRNSNGAVMVSGYLGNLKSATTYHYRLFAVPYDSSGNPDWAHASIGRDATAADAASAPAVERKPRRVVLVELVIDFSLCQRLRGSMVGAGGC